MSRNLDTPIVSIYDMMIERHRKLTSESESRDISLGAQKVLRGKVVEEVISNTKLLPKKHRTTKAVREMPSSITLESEYYCPSSTITASHLTKKQTFLRVQPPANREIISKLVEKMTMVCGRAKAEDVVPTTSQGSPKQSSGKRKEMATPGTSRNKQKSIKSNPDRRPLSSRKADRGAKEKVERVQKKKIMAKSPTKLSKNSGRKMRSVRESSRSFKAVPLSNDRWRI
ncbi:uncharacterized protein LOC110178067 [Drosophila serrata]|uniref:uncharacterized protein LOC110178067 n=1 Tax=Drosophila serrata TaxID=7274 RepID=UPI000A1D30B3|nr:uncharacterized protein LOC110178067 [Drosophila serrata]